MFETLRKGQAVCEQHGEYERSEIMYGPLGTIWTPCPSCEAAEKEKRDMQATEEHAKMMRDHKLNILLSKSGVPRKFKGKTFNGYRPMCAKAMARLTEVVDYAALLVDNPQQPQSLIMIGKVGTGKTHLACAMIEYVIRQTLKQCQYVAFSEVVRRVKSSWRNGSEESEQDIYDSLASPYLLVIDEVGMQRFTDFERTVAYEVINARYIAENPTVMVSNLAAKDLKPTIGDRAIDRLRENGGQALLFDWESYRSSGGVQ